jgi:hypothetical protein
MHRGDGGNLMGICRTSLVQGPQRRNPCNTMPNKIRLDQGCDVPLVPDVPNVPDVPKTKNPHHKMMRVSTIK